MVRAAVRYPPWGRRTGRDASPLEGAGQPGGAGGRVGGGASAVGAVGWRNRMDDSRMVWVGQRRVAGCAGTATRVGRSVSSQARVAGGAVRSGVAAAVGGVRGRRSASGGCR